MITRAMWHLLACLAALGWLVMAAPGCATSRRGEGDSAGGRGGGSRLGDGGLPELVEGLATGADSESGGAAGAAVTQAWLGQVRGVLRPCNADPKVPVTRLLLLLQFDANGKLLSGSATFGDDPLLPPTDPYEVYPPEPFWEINDCPRQFGMEGFDYPISESERHGGQLVLTIEMSALWEQWCAMQPTHAVPGHLHHLVGPYACRPAHSWDFVVGDSSVLTAAARCLSDCACDADGCVAMGDPDARFDAVSRSAFRLTFTLRQTEDGELVGSLLSSGSWPSEGSQVRLARVQ